MFYSPYDEFPHEITFQQYVDSQEDGAGGYTEGGWQDFATSEALVTSVSSREIAQAEQTRNPIDYEVYYPYRDDVLPSMRVLYEGKVLSIKSKPMDQGGQHEVMLIECSRGNASDGQE
jgi:SPP1 family predicted phage head-tail adaptor